MATTSVSDMTDQERYEYFKTAQIGLKCQRCDHIYPCIGYEFLNRGIFPHTWIQMRHQCPDCDQKDESSINQNVTVIFDGKEVEASLSLHNHPYHPDAGGSLIKWEKPHLLFKGEKKIDARSRCYCKISYSYDNSSNRLSPPIPFTPFLPEMFLSQNDHPLSDAQIEAMLKID